MTFQRHHTSFWVDGIVAKGGPCPHVDSRGFTLIHHVIEPSIRKTDVEASACQVVWNEMKRLIQTMSQLGAQKPGERVCKGMRPTVGEKRIEAHPGGQRHLARAEQGAGCVVRLQRALPLDQMTLQPLTGLC